jgi:hypothetical protein
MFAECPPAVLHLLAGLSAGMKWRRMFLQRRKLELADLYEEPFTNFGANAVEKLFSEGEIQELVRLVKRLAA